MPLAETQKSLPSGSRSTVHAMPSGASSCYSTTTAPRSTSRRTSASRRGRDTLEAQLDTPCVHEDVLPYVLGDFTLVERFGPPLGERPGIPAVDRHGDDRKTHIAIVSGADNDIRRCPLNDRALTLNRDESVVQVPPRRHPRRGTYAAAGPRPRRGHGTKCRNGTRRPSGSDLSPVNDNCSRRVNVGRVE